MLAYGISRPTTSVIVAGLKQGREPGKNEGRPGVGDQCGMEGEQKGLGFEGFIWQGGK